MRENSKIVNYLLNSKKPYILKIGNMKVEMKYLESNKTFNECMLNILKQRIKK